jgi:hypothetical protein
LIVSETLRVGDLVTPTHATQPAWIRKHGFGVVIGTEVSSEYKTVIYVVKFTKSEQVYKFGFDGVKLYGQD